ncbi:cytochrome b-c1 complex subunit 2, mitochondrial [Anoplophora glabripennis]|uniref:cytochrome b-c1 complex subunit 2, mitochondrial n=1 Tax=Anoplophora glabripennis TaxID=217634 RepID=UPI0008749DB5|nr:cytochrome b-c1 complex subunit 2, mitochondrial [Anoplophora glabripennis]
MALNIPKLPLIRIVTTRGYAQLAPVGGVSTCEFKNVVLSNKLVVASAENESSISRISIVFRAGSRNESSDNLGVTHVLRNSAGLSTRNASQFAIIRNIQQVGASLSATSDRETISYTLEGTRQAVEKALPFLTEVATQQVFKPWEISEITNRLLLDIATRPLQLRAIDLVHNAAFRSGLGNSLFIPKSQIGKISSETLQHYVASTFLTGRASVVGLGVNSAELEQYANSLRLESGEGCSTASIYKGGELRSNKGGNIAFVAIAGEGAALNNTKEALAFAVLQRAIGVGPHIKWSTRDNGLLSKSIGVTTEDYASSAFNASYADTGLFGVLIAAPSRSAGGIVESAVKLIRGSRISEEDVTRGKNQLKTALLLDAESGSQTLQSIANQSAILRGQIQSPAQVASAVDSVSTADVQNALKKVGQRLTLASIGNLSNVPYLDELK